jgi:5-methylcytosine-specific restriction endonuclease McrA
MKKEDRIKVYEKFNGKCAYCGRDIEFKEMQVDHYYPQCNTGYAKTFGIDINSFDNLMPSCRRCNHYKRAELPEHFRTQMKTLHKRLMKIYIVKVAIDYGIIELKPFNGVFYFERGIS